MNEAQKKALLRKTAAAAAAAKPKKNRTYDATLDATRQIGRASCRERV